MPKKEEEIRKMKRKRTAGTILLLFVMAFIFIIGVSIGFITGIKYSAAEYVGILKLVFENSNVDMQINMTLNQTEMMDYMIDKMGINNGTITKKEYILPCEMNNNIPRGETDRCIEPQVINEVEGVKYNFSLAR
jgi:hypothetical protein